MNTPMLNKLLQMAKLITNDDTLRQYLPNVFATVKGEMSLFNKIKVNLTLRRTG